MPRVASVSERLLGSERPHTASTQVIGVTSKARQQVNPVKDVDRAVDGLGRETPFGIADVLIAGPVFKPTVVPNILLEATVIEQTGLGADWFETVHLLPRLGFQFGNIISTTTHDIEIYNSFRDGTVVTFTSFTNNTGPGIALTPDPSPAAIASQRSIIVVLEVDAVGSAT